MMKDKLKQIYRQIKDGQVSPEEGARLLQALSRQADLTAPANEIPFIRKYVYDQSIMKDHTVKDKQVLIGMTHGSLVLDAWLDLFPDKTNVRVKQLTFIDPIELNRGEFADVRIAINPSNENWEAIVMYQKNNASDWKNTAKAFLEITEPIQERIDIVQLKKQLRPVLDLDKLYQANPLVKLGSSFKTVISLSKNQTTVLSRIRLEPASSEIKYKIDPLIAHSAYLLCAAQMEQLGNNDGYLPFGIKNIDFSQTLPLTEYWLLVDNVKNSGEMVLFDAYVVNDEGLIVIKYLGCSMKRIRTAMNKRNTTPQQEHMHISADNTITATIESFLFQQINNFLKNEEPVNNEEENLMDLGLESSQLVELTEKLQDKLKIELSPTLFFEYPNIKELTGYFQEEFSEKFEMKNQKKHESFTIKKEQSISIEKEQPLSTFITTSPVRKTKEDQQGTTSEASAIREDIAIIGMSGRFAQANDLDQFWKNLAEGKNVMTEIPETHWDYKPWFAEEPEENMTYCKWGSFIDDVDKFDSAFFNISPREADWMDPQLRLLLENIYATSEDAGYANRLKGTKTGVFIGVCSADYVDRIAELDLPVDPYVGTGTSQTVLANRISFNFDLTGPSIAINTACSSALFALHSAIHALRNQECEMAFVGGVNLLLSSYHYRYFSSINALSKTGRCHTFDAAADGYTPGECVGSILLKPLKKALEDSDRIIALVKGSAALHGGYTPSITAPSVAGQENVILNAWKNAGIPPETITYVEAHGTGTKLGDPIEINSLKKAFKKFTDKEHFCHVGSSKGNIGHAEGGAGIAGLLKVLMQMQHRQIPALPEFKELNPYIDLKRSALIIEKKLVDWNVPNGIPRRAGISSFGFSGAYAHVVLEEFLNERKEQVVEEFSQTVIITLSAKNDDRLKARVNQLIMLLEEGTLADADLMNISYSLNIGREPMESRLGVMVDSVKELKEKLITFVKDNLPTAGVYTGEIKKNKQSFSSLLDDEDIQAAIQQLLQKKKYNKLLELWVKGAQINWTLLYDREKVSLLSLPTYPFNKKRHWFTDHLSTTSAEKLSAKINDLSPLVHKNTSNFEEQQFTSIFTGKEFFLQDHQINGVRILPGVAYLEMVCRATMLSVSAEQFQKISIKNVIWAKPIHIHDQAVEVITSLLPAEDNGIHFQVATKKDLQLTVNSKGVLYLDSTLEAPAPLDIESIKASFTKGMIEKDVFYSRFAAIGFTYGKTHQSVQKIYLGEQTILAELVLPEMLKASMEKYVLNPSIMDAGLQAAVTLMSGGAELDLSGNTKSALPFAIEQQHVFKPTAPKMWALLTFSKGSHANDTVVKIDIQFCDEHGNVCIDIKGYSCRVIDSKEKAVPIVAPAAMLKKAGKKGAAGLQNAGNLKDKTTSYLVNLLASVVQMPSDTIETDVMLEEYGIDSIIIMKLTGELEKVFGTLSKTLFFEYKTLNELIDYFLSAHETKLLGIFVDTINGNEMAKRPEEKLPEIPAMDIPPIVGKNRFNSFGSLKNMEVTRSETGALDIAIIGLSGKYPKSKNIYEYWEHLHNGTDCITEIPKERWDHDEYYDADKSKFGKTYAKWGGFIDGVDKFDSLFFNISPREAEFLDPQERLFLECAYETIEDAGYTREKLQAWERNGLKGNVGVYVGVMYQEYQLFGAQYTAQGKPLALPGNPSSIANRVSYFFNFHGPSLALDTMCSSSITAIHLACQALANKDCRIALAGGVNVNVHPNKYLFLAQGKFASSTGRCQSFGRDGDGYVPAEGVGAILLKPLKEAITDGDHIYGIIKSTAINHGGKNNGYSVPNPAAQTDVIERAIAQAGINPRAISYIEAHGTGTSLGDPIEIQSLTKAFRKYTADTGFCAIGSSKSNIGHCESAAGIGGITKVLLQLKYKQIVPSLHSETLNPNIDFTTTPFIVQQELMEWKPTVLKEGNEYKEYPRISGISSFGAGGSNAHILIQEYTNNHEYTSSGTGEMIVLSAHSKEQLMQKVQELHQFIGKEKLNDHHLYSIAYTLQNGREFMEERVAFIATSIQDLKAKLELTIADQLNDETLFKGCVVKNAARALGFENKEELIDHINACISDKQYIKLLKAWVQGASIPFQTISDGKLAARIPLPTYPFDRTRYWVPEIEYAPEVVRSYSSERIKPDQALQLNTEFTGDEFFLQDHRINGERMLPGVMYLELACKAAVKLGKFNEGQQLRLKDIIWAQPFSIEKGNYSLTTQVDEKDGSVSFRIFDDKGEQKKIFSKGTIEKTQGQEGPFSLDEIRKRCDREKYTGDYCYERMNGMGLQYGLSHRAIQEIFTGPDEVIARLKIDHSFKESIHEYDIHPGLIDAALQSTMAHTFAQKETFAAIPFALDSITMYHKCHDEMWVRSTPSKKEGHKLAGNLKLDIDIMDRLGNVCLSLKGFTFRAIEKEHQQKKDPYSTLLLVPEWKEKNAASSQQVDYDKRIVVTTGEGFFLEEAKFKNTEFFQLGSKLEKSAQRYEHNAMELFQLVKSKLQTIGKDKLLFQVICEKDSLLEGLAGLLKTARLENPSFTGQLIALDKSSSLTAELIAANGNNPQDVHIRYLQNKKYILNWAEERNNASEKPWKDVGTYLITGGAGELGLLIANEIAETTTLPVLILTGRSVLTAEKETQLEQLRSKGAVVEYHQVDVTDRSAFEKVILHVLNEYSSIEGIIHSAGLIKDNFILRKNVDELPKVMGPKVNGLYNMDELTAKLSLDFLILFSSGAGAVGNPGQADYAMANAFMDQFAFHRNRLTQKGLRFGKTLSINWPLWKDGGMKVNEQTEKMMLDTIGMIPMRKESGIEALYKAWASDNDQVMVIEGDQAKLKQLFGIQSTKRNEPASDALSRLFDGIEEGTLSENEFLLSI